MRYGITAWGNSTHCNQLQRSQNRLLKILTKTRHSTVDTNIQNQNQDLISDILNVKEIYKLTMINTYYNERQYLAKISHRHDTRAKRNGKMVVEKYNNNNAKFALPSIIPTLMNELPANLLNLSKNINRKQILKEFFINNK